jgi:adenine deaminase
MNFPGVIAGESEMLERIAAAGERAVDGHSPGVSGPALDAYLAAGVESDHEATTAAEALEKRRKGMWVFLREGSASRNLAALAPTIVEHGTERAALCTDDREPSTLLADGHINDCARIAVAHGVSEVDALRLASTNPARYHRLHHLGSLGPGHQADVLAFDALASWTPARVWRRGPPGAAARAAARHRPGRPDRRRPARSADRRRNARARDRRREPLADDPPARAAGRIRRGPGAGGSRRAPPRERADRHRLRHRLRPGARSARLDGRPRRP